MEPCVRRDPLRALRTGSVPFWALFNTEPSCAELDRHLRSAAPDREVHVSVFSHGTDSPGVVPAARWKELARRRRGRPASGG